MSGGALSVASADAVTISDSLFAANVATKGGAVRVRNDNPGAAAGAVSFVNSSFEGNVAQYGGALLVDAGGAATAADCFFTRNAARAAGGGVSVGDGGAVVLARTSFSANGNFSCDDAPAAGGGLAVGMDEFKPYVGCTVKRWREGEREREREERVWRRARAGPARPPSLPPFQPPPATPATATVTNCTFTANVAHETGGGVAVRAGALALVGSTLSANAVTGSPSSRALPSPDAPPSTATARGGGLYVGGSCVGGGACAAATAVLDRVALDGNAAAEAGGGLFFEGLSSNLSSITVIGGSWTGNAAPRGGGGGAGGGAALEGAGFSISNVSLAANAARYGGAMFVSAPWGGTRVAALANLTFAATNAAARGGDAFWVAAASPSTPFICTACTFAALNVDLAAAGGGGGRVATEARSAALAGAAPSSVQSGSPAPAFSVALLDHYGAVSTTDTDGQCVAGGGGAGVLLAESGRAARADVGVALFDRLVVTGGVNSSITLDLACAPPGAGRPAVLPPVAPLPPLALAVAVAACPRGRQPPPAGTLYPVCIPCPFGSYSYDGVSCAPCREGGLCPGGAAGESTPLKSYAGYWRSSNAIDVPLYRCPASSACRGVAAGSAESGDAAGDAACAAGTKGPLCAVCADGFYKFGGGCK